MTKLAEFCWHCARSRVNYPKQLAKIFALKRLRRDTFF